jgi:hypothetical protein
MVADIAFVAIAATGGGKAPISKAPPICGPKTPISHDPVG